MEYNFPQIRFLKATLAGFGLFFVVCIVTGCAGQIRQFYPDTYYEQDRIYENKPIGFSFSYRGNWNIVTDPQKMRGAGKELAQELNANGTELLFVGFTVEENQGTRAIAANLNESPEEYAAQVRELNKKTISEDFGITPFIAGQMEMVKWEYIVGEFWFAEFFFVVDTYDVRVAFWAKRDLYQKFLPVYEDIISSVRQ